ncbi:hypothetical protein [Pseudescherichia vulneris]|uniref:hypothetical protein n=1 Tax=Pseudescherichia vulneris TaxID=566 RepID=UPI003019D110
MKRVFISVFLLASFTASANYLECDIFNGKVSNCSSAAQSDSVPVEQSDGYFHDCAIFNGSVSSCTSWTQAENVPLLQSDGYYKSCSIFNGKVSSCFSWYQGKAIISQD